MVAAILNLKKCTRGIFGASSEFVWGDVQVSFLKKSAFCNFIPGSCVFFTNALVLLVGIREHILTVSNSIPIQPVMGI